MGTRPVLGGAANRKRLPSGDRAHLTVGAVTTGAANMRRGARPEIPYWCRCPRPSPGRSRLHKTAPCHPAEDGTGFVHRSVFVRGLAGAATANLGAAGGR